MFTLHEVKRLKDLPIKTQKHLFLLSTFQIKPILAVYTFILLNFSIVPLFFPNSPTYSVVILPLIILMNFWCLFLLFQNVYDIQVIIFLFFGILGIVGMLAYYLAFYKYVFVLLEAENVLLLVLSLLALLFTIIFFIVYYLKINSSKYDTSVNKTNVNSGAIAALAPVIGYMLYQSVSRHSNEAVLLLMGVIFYIFTIFFTYTAIKFLHKYLFIKANLHLIKLEKPLREKRGDR